MNALFTSVRKIKIIHAKENRMKKIALSVILATVCIFATSSIAAESKTDVKKCMASARGKKGSDSKACMKLKGAERKDCRQKADQAFESAKMACNAKS